MSFIIGIDLGGTKTEVALVNLKGKIVKSKLFATSQKGADFAIDDILQAISELSSSVKVIAVGIGVAGQIDASTGTIHFSPNLNWVDVPIQNEIQKGSGLPVSVLNDVKAASLAEWQYGAGKGVNDLVCMYIGTGIGGGIISQGKLLNGSSNTAGEFGHMIITMDGMPCTCGSRGCLETVASGWGLEKLAQKSPKMVVEEYHKNDLFCKELIEQFYTALIIAGVNIVNTLNPEMIILGGGVIRDLPELIDRFEKGVKLRALKAASEKLKCARAQFGAQAGVVGAAFFAQETLNYR